MEAPRRDPLRRCLDRLSHFRRKIHQSRKTPVQLTDSDNDSHVEEQDSRSLVSIFTHRSCHEDIARGATRTPVSAVASMTAIMSSTHDSGESLVGHSLRGSASSPALGLSNHFTGSPRLARERDCSDESMRVDSKFGDTEHSEETLSYDASRFDSSLQRLPGLAPLCEDQIDGARPRRLSLLASLPSRMSISTEVDSASAQSPPASLSLRDKRRSQRMSLRSPVSFTLGSPTDNYQVLLPLQVSEGTDAHEADLNSTEDPRSWSVLSPVDRKPDSCVHSLEARAERLFGADHLRTILGDPQLLFAFSGFLSTYRPWRRSLLGYYWDAIKALRAMNYARAIVDDLSERPLPCIGSAATPPVASVDARLSAAASEVLDDILREDLPAYVTQVYTRIVVASVQRRITGALSTHLRETSHGLAEVFVLTDPSRPDNPIILASEEFALTTRYGLKFVIGRNSRFLQGPFTSKHAVRRLAIASEEGKEHTELIVNYRRDGTPFLNLLMIAPLLDSHGKVRYWLGAQVDVSGLLKDDHSLASLHKLVASQTKPEDSCRPERSDRLLAMRDLSTMLGGDEVEIVRRHGGYLNQGYSHLHDTTPAGIATNERSRILLQEDEELLQNENCDPNIGSGQKTSPHQRITHWQPESIYKHYLILRPGKSLRILFASAALRVPGMLQSHFLHRIGGSAKMRSDLEKSLQQGTAVTARVHWLSVPNRYGDGAARPRWCHCTPLLHHSGAVGLWVVVIVDDDEVEEGLSASEPNGRSEVRRGAGPGRLMTGLGLVDPGVLAMERLRAMHRDFGRRPSTAI